ncbi:MAG TPA: NlpC/P60 family protein [Smithellaceae bacterium]|nr:NlpC/P60 family protein [Smithellaceae bacterium]HRS83636.1 NlpC/P60 family protein [Smithellaceae bacterium]HRV44540.1 NlpC/P60 family protein [Smithellaceae bacterium]
MMQRRTMVSWGLFALFLLFCFQIDAHAAQYKVKKGENLSLISKRTGVSIAEIKKANHLQGNFVKPGQILSLKEKASPSPVTAKSKIQPSSSYIVKRGDTLPLIARKTGVPVMQIAKLNHVTTKSLRAGQKLILPREEAPAKAPAEEEDDLLDEEDEGLTDDPSAAISFEEKTSEELLGKWGSAEERKLFIRVATGFLGAPYRLGGATVKGIDCSAFVRKMYEFFDITLPRTAREQSTVGMKVKRDELVEGDLVFFRTKKPIGHVGIYIGNNEFVHASYKAKAVRIDSLDRPYFQKRFQRAVRLKGLDENDGT